MPSPNYGILDADSFYDLGAPSNSEGRVVAFGAATAFEVAGTPYQRCAAVSCPQTTPDLVFGYTRNSQRWRIYWWQYIPTIAQAELLWLDEWGSAVGVVSLESTGQIAYHRTDSAMTIGNLVAASTVQAYAGRWNHLCVEITVDYTAGVISFWLNGDAAGTFTGLNTSFVAGLASPAANSFSFRGTKDGRKITGYVAQDPDVAGFLGMLTPRCAFPIADSEVAWTPSAGTDRFAMVDEGADGVAGPDDDATKNSSGTSGAIDLFVYEDLGLPSTTQLYAIVQRTRSQVDVAGAGLIRQVIKRATIAASGSDVPLPYGGYAYQSEVFDTDPSTGVAFADLAAGVATAGGYEQRAT